MPTKLPYPPLEMRQLVGPTDLSAFDNPSGERVLPEISMEYYARVLDFGCGCGRLARQMIQQNVQPTRYLGVDLHRGMVHWCNANLAPCAPQFTFRHHDVYNKGFNPNGKPGMIPVPAEDHGFTLIIAWSVFTHILEANLEHYLNEMGRCLAPNGLLWSTWFLFDKRYFPMMQDFQNALYINAEDATNAVIYDQERILSLAGRIGLRLVAAFPPSVRGYQWRLVFSNNESAPEQELGFDGADFGIVRPPVPASDALSEIGV